MGRDANTERRHASPASGGSSFTTRRRCSPVTERAQRSRRAAISVARPTGASNALPSSRPRKASPTSAGVRTCGGGAGTSTRRALSRPIASTIPVSADLVSAAPSTEGSSAHTAPGTVRASSARRSGSTTAGVQRTEYEPRVSLARAPRRGRRFSNGTIAPVAVSSTAQHATRPIQRTLAPTSSPT